MGERVNSPQPTKYTENVKEDLRSIYMWAHDWFRTTVMRQRLAARLDAMAAIAQLTQIISNPPTKAQVEAIQSKINEIINASQ